MFNYFDQNHEARMNLSKEFKADTRKIGIYDEEIKSRLRFGGTLKHLRVC